MVYNNLDLRNKTFLDYADDSEIKKEVFDDTEFFINNLTIEMLIFSWLDYAEYIQDEKLISIIEKEFQHELDSFFNE